MHTTMVLRLPRRAIMTIQYQSQSLSGLSGPVVAPAEDTDPAGGRLIGVRVFQFREDFHGISGQVDRARSVAVNPDPHD
jgi:hypothetical protein